MHAHVPRWSLSNGSASSSSRDTGPAVSRHRVSASSFCDCTTCCTKRCVLTSINGGAPACATRRADTSDSFSSATTHSTDSASSCTGTSSGASTASSSLASSTDSIAISSADAAYEPSAATASGSRPTTSTNQRVGGFCLCLCLALAPAQRQQQRHRLGRRQHAQLHPPGRREAVSLPRREHQHAR